MDPLQYSEISTHTQIPVQEKVRNVCNIHSISSFLKNVSPPPTHKHPRSPYTKVCGEDYQIYFVTQTWFSGGYFWINFKTQIDLWNLNNIVYSIVQTKTLKITEIILKYISSTCEISGIDSIAWTATTLKSMYVFGCHMWGMIATNYVVMAYWVLAAVLRHEVERNGYKLRK